MRLEHSTPETSVVLPSKQINSMWARSEQISSTSFSVKSLSDKSSMANSVASFPVLRDSQMLTMLWHLLFAMPFLLFSVVINCHFTNPSRCNFLWVLLFSCQEYFLIISGIMQSSNINLQTFDSHVIIMSSFNESSSFVKSKFLILMISHELFSSLICWFKGLLDHIFMKELVFFK